MTVKPNRLYYGTVCFCLMLMLGLFYTWSVFISPLEAAFGWSRGQVSAIFSISVIFFSLGNLTGSYCASRVNVKHTFGIAGILVFIGFIWASFSSTLIMHFLSYGVIYGFATGICYNCVLNIASHWFPEKQGIISGIMLMGFGIGGLILGPFSALLISKFSWRIAFRVWGLLLSSAVFLCSYLIRMPSEGETVSYLKKQKQSPEVDFIVNLSWLEMIQTQSFKLFALWTTIVCTGGLALVGHAAPYAKAIGLSAAAAASVPGLFLLANGVGGLMFGYIWDLFGRKITMFINGVIFIFAFTVLFFNYYIQYNPLAYTGFITAGIAYSGGLTINSAFVNDFYGNKHYAGNFSILSLTIIPAAFLGPVLFGEIQSVSDSYLPYFILLILGMIVCIAVAFYIQPPEKEQAQIAIEKTKQETHNSAKEQDITQESTINKGETVMTKEYKINGMSCGHCVNHVSEALKIIPDVLEVQVDLETGNAVVSFQGNIPEDAAIAAVIEEAGYELEQI